MRATIFFIIGLLFSGIGVSSPPALGQEVPTTSQEQASEPSTRSLDDLKQLRKSVVAEIETMGGRVSPSGVVTVLDLESEGDPATPESTSHRPISDVAGLAQNLLARIDAQLSSLSMPMDESFEPEPTGLLNTRGVDQATGFSDLDSALDRLAEAESAARSADVRTEEARRDLEAAEKRAEYLEKKHRLARSESEDSDRGPMDRILNWQARVAREDAHLARLRLTHTETALSSLRAHTERLRTLASTVRDRLEVSADDLAQISDQIETQAQRERDMLSELEIRVDEANRSWLQATRKSADDGSPEPAYRQAVLDTLEIERQIRLQRLEMLELQSKVWRYRFVAAGLEPTEDRRRRESFLEEARGELRRLSKAEQTRVDGLKSLREQTDLLDREPGDPWLRRQVDVVSTTIALVGSLQEELLATERLTERTLEATRAETVAIGEMLGNLGQAFIDTWHWEIFSVDDNPITLGNSVVVLLMIVLGYGLAKWLSRFLAGLLVRRFSVSSGAAHAFQSFVFYLLTISFVLWGLDIVGIPLTVFTLLGGVVAIGLGFGSQNIVNNFISGLILLIERPIKIGDLIDVDGLLGTVESIGLRSTRIRAGNNTQIIVPNSSFLEKNVLNWTGSDNLVRSQVDVGVAYGSPVDKVRDLMIEGLNAEPKVVKKPPPEVLFIEFGDNALLFRAYFWHSVRAGLDAVRVQSALRFRFDKLMADAEIVIAFPQRDVHLDTLSPLKIQLMKHSE